MVPPIRIKLEITPASGSARPRTFPSFREAAEYTGLSISGLRDAYHRGRTRVSRRDGTEFKFKVAICVASQISRRTSSRW